VELKKKPATAELSVGLAAQFTPAGKNVASLQTSLEASSQFLTLSPHGVQVESELALAAAVVLKLS